MDASECPKCGYRSTGARAVKAFDISVAPGTRHYALLNSNEPPEDSESTFVQLVISETDARLACLDNEISKLREKLRPFEEERASLLSYRARNKAILSPLRRMPPETMGEIFSWTLPSVRQSWEQPNYMAGSPWVLSYTSSRWRAISLSTPPLWSRIVINYGQTTCPTITTITAQLQRAEKLKIHFYGFEDADSRPQIEMFQLLMQLSSRWEELSLALTTELFPLVSGLHDRLPLLERVWIQWESPTEAQSIDCFRVAPSLVAFGTFNQHFFVPVILPGHQLTRYQFDGPWSQHMDMLKMAPNLVEAYVVVSFDYDPWPADPTIPETIPLAHLRQLYMSDVNVLRYLKAPALEELAFRYPEYPEDTPASDFLRFFHPFLDRSDCPLRRLCLKGFPEADGTTQILGKLPFITELVIMIDEANDDEELTLLMSALTIAGRTVVAPQLRSFVVGCEDEIHIDYTAYLEMLQFRWKTEGCALNTATLATAGPGPDPTTLQGLRALRREGLELMVLAGADGTDEIESWEYFTSWC